MSVAKEAAMEPAGSGSATHRVLSRTAEIRS
jgi:hypothetical protein